MITVVGSLKGGSGKSTVTFNLAVWLATAEQKVLAIDADPQATLTDVLEVRDEENYHPSIGTIGAAGLDDRLLMDKYDEVLIDIGTADFERMKQAITLADRIIVPVPPSQADIWSTQRFLRFVSSISGQSPPDIIGFINRADTHQAIRESDEAAAALISIPGIRYIEPRLGQRTVFRRSFSEGLAVFELDKRSKAALEWQVLAVELFPGVRA